MSKCISERNLTRREVRELLYDMTMVRQDGERTHPKLTIITLKKPLRIVTSAHRSITKRDAINWINSAMAIGTKYDDCFEVKTYSIRFQKARKSSHNPLIAHRSNVS